MGKGGLTGFHNDINRVIHKVVNVLIVEGTHYKKSYLEYYFPKNDSTPYVGAAHGIIGILYMLIKALQGSPKL